MRQFVKSLGRLYSSNKVSEEKILELYTDGKITESEMNYILSCENSTGN